MKTFDLDKPLLEFASKEGSVPFTMRMACEGIGIFGSIGAGKSSSSAMYFSKKMLEQGFGGIVLTAKNSEKRDWIDWCNQTGRRKDLLILEPNGYERFNFMDYLGSHPMGMGLTGNIVDVPILEISGKLKNRKHLIEYGTLKNNPAVRIAFASQLSSGMVDAAILTTELINTFSPKVVIMAGVLGGKPDDVEIGDIVVATKVLTIDKGKLTEAGFKSESEGSATDSAYVTGIKRKKKDIIQYISTSDQTRTKAPQIHFGPIACVRYVVDKEGFFNTALEPVDRKTIALEMESYGVARACELSEISPAVLIIKSAMDNTRDKVDDAKHYAAWTSAKVVQYILENGII